MISLSQTTGYAIMALSYLGGPSGDRRLERDIAESTGISKPYLSKLIYKLGESGLIDGKRGYKGGIRLTRPANEITMLEIAEAVDGAEWRNKCLLGLPKCGEGQPCPLHEFWGTTRTKIEQNLSSFTLDRVREFTEKGWRV